MTLRLDVRERTRLQAAEEFNENHMCVMLVDVAFVDAFASWSGPANFKLQRDSDGLVTMDMRDPLVQVVRAAGAEDDDAA